VCDICIGAKWESELACLCRRLGWLYRRSCTSFLMLGLPAQSAATRGCDAGLAVCLMKGVVSSCFNLLPCLADISKARSLSACLACCCHGCSAVGSAPSHVPSLCCPDSICAVYLCARCAATRARCCNSEGFWVALFCLFCCCLLEGVTQD
jgi:hypothetical protein